MAGQVSQAAGSFWTFSLALLVVLVWAATGPIFHYSETWQLVINTGTTIVTFLMVFVIQHAQNKDMRAVQLKLNELIAAVEGASNRLIDVEDLTDRELEHLYTRFQTLAKSAQKALPRRQAHDRQQRRRRRAHRTTTPHSEADKRPVSVQARSPSAHARSRRNR